MFKLTENLFGCLVVIGLIIGMLIFAGSMYESMGLVGFWGTIMLVLGGLAWYFSSTQKTCPDCGKSGIPKSQRVCQVCGYRWQSP